MIKHSITPLLSLQQGLQISVSGRAQSRCSCRSPYRLRQQGMALFITIIILVLVTSLAAVVITDSRMGANAIGLTKERFTHEQELLGGYDEVISDVTLIDTIMAMSSSTALKSEKFPKVSVQLQYRNDSYCKRSAQASSVNLINCKYVKMTFSQEQNGKRVQGGALASGVAQPFLAAQNK